MLLQNFSTLPSGNALVMMSTILTALGQYSNFPCLRHAPSQSRRRSQYAWILPMRLRSHSAFLTAWAAAMYSALAVGTVMVACSRLDQLMMEDPK